MSRKDKRKQVAEILEKYSNQSNLPKIDTHVATVPDRYKAENRYGQGNIDLTNRPVVKNSNGSISTVRSISFYDDKEKKEILVPTVVNGKVVSNDEAIDNYYKTGQFLGKFNTVDEANAYAEKLHQDQDKMYRQPEQQMSTWDKVKKNAGFIAKYTGNEAVGAVENQLQGYGYDAQNYSRSKGNQSLVAAAADAARNVGGFATGLGAINSVIDSIPRQFKILKDTLGSDKKAGEKIIDYISASMTNTKTTMPLFSQMMEMSNLGTEATETITGKDKEDIINAQTAATREISRNYENRRDSYEQDESVGNGVKTAARVFGQVGRMLPTIATSVATGEPDMGLFYTMGQSVMGSTVNERLDKGESLEEATNRGNLEGAKEVATEKMFGGIHALGGGTLDKFTTGISSKVTKVLGKKLTGLIGDALGESVEEIVGDVGEYIVNIAKGEDTDLSWSNEWETTWQTWATTLILNALTDGMVGLNTAGSKAVVNKSNLDATTKANLEEFVKDKQITKQGASALVNGITDIEDKAEVNKLLKSGELQDVVEYVNTAAAEGRTNIINNAEISDEEKAALTRVAEKGRYTGEQIRKVLDNKAELEDTTKRLQTFNESASKYNLDTENPGIKAVFDLTNRRGVQARFDADLDWGKGENAMWIPGENGSREIVINPNAEANKTLENLAVHEITHDMEGTKEYKQLADLILNGSKVIEGRGVAYDSIYKSYKDFYEKKGKKLSAAELKEIADSEFVANAMGDTMGSQEFIDYLMENTEKSTIQKIIDAIGNVINKLTGYKDQQKYWREVQEKYKKAFDAKYQPKNKDTRASIGVHYGDLGKGRDTYYEDMGRNGSRSTGYFGTGTYFFSEEASESENGKRFGKDKPRHEVDLSEYNLFRPKSDADAKKLHDLLRDITKLNYEDTNLNLSKLNGDFNFDKYSFNMSESELKEALDKLGIKAETLEEFKDRRYKEAESDANELEELQYKWNDEKFGKDRQQFDYEMYLRSLLEDTEHTAFNTDILKSDLKNIFGYSKSKDIDRALNAVKDYVQNNKPTYGSKQDSLSTVFMKAMGYNGIDVTGYESVDNSSYGSVVYDLNNKINKDISYSIDSNRNAKFTEERLNSIIDDSVTKWTPGYANNYVTRMTPQQFLDLTTTPEIMERLKSESRELNEEDLKNESQNIYLNVDMETGRVVGHEGRHRMIALQNAGVENVDIVIHPVEGTYNKDNAEDFNYGLYLIGQRLGDGIKGKNVNAKNPMIAVNYKNIDKIKNEFLSNANESDVRYSIDNTDSQGRKLTKEQQEFFKDSSKEILTKSGKIQRWYHTMTNAGEAFNEFNPVGTPGYKFGNQVVNFVTNNKTMSESYADDMNEKPVRYDINGNEGKHKYIYEGYLNVKNPFVVDSNNRNYGQANIRLNEQQEEAIKTIANMSENEIAEAKKLQKQALNEFIQGDERTQALREIRNELKGNGYEEERLAIDVGNAMKFVEEAEQNGTKTGEALERFREANTNYAKSLIKEAYPNYDDYLVDVTFDNLLYDYNNKTLDFRNSSIGDKLGIDKELTLREIDTLLNEKNPNAVTDVLARFKELLDESNLSDDIKKLANMEVNNFENLNQDSKYYKTGISNLYSALAYKGSRDSFNINNLKESIGGNKIAETTNDVIKRVLQMNKEGANYDAVIFKNLYDYGGATTGENRGSGDVVAFFNSNQFKDINNLNPTDNPDFRYSIEDTSNNSEENEWQRKVNRSMTMEQAKDMVQRAFVVGDIKEWFDGEYNNGDEWLAGEGADAVALIIDNDYNLQNKFVNGNEDIMNEEYMIEDVIEAYQNGTLVGSSDKQTQRLDTSKDTGFVDNRFYAPKDINADTELYNKANERVTNKNRQEIYKARADFIINAHNEGYIESLGLTQKEVNEKLRKWTSYPKKAMETSIDINKGVAKENRWTGIENCSIVNELSVTKEQLDSMVKKVKGTTHDYQRRYISNTMLAIDTHMNFKELTFDFAPDVKNMGERVLGDYQGDYDVIRVKRDGQNTVSHEMTHYLDHLMGRELANGYNLGLTRLCRTNINDMANGVKFTEEQKQFIQNFRNFLEDIENSSDAGSSYKMDSQEVFARFGARFVEWTRNLATGNRYGYEAEWYKDNFTTSQYKEFAKLLQEYSLLKTTGQASGRTTTTANINRTSDVKYSLEPTQDNQGRELSKEQQEYFKDVSPELKDEDGNLKTYYHGTHNDFNVFDKNKIGSNTYNEGLFGKGFYFTNLQTLAEGYSKYREGNQHVKEVYLNITNPFNWNSIKTKEQMEQFIEDNNIPEGILEWNPYQQEIHTITEIENERAFSKALQESGYDGIVYQYRQIDENHEPVQEVVVFESNQIKNVDNKKPTSNPDIRYSIETKEISDEDAEDINKYVPLYKLTPNQKLNRAKAYNKAMNDMLKEYVDAGAGDDFRVTRTDAWLDDYLNGESAKIRKLVEDGTLDAELFKRFMNDGLEEDIKEHLGIDVNNYTREQLEEMQKKAHEEAIKTKEINEKFEKLQTDRKFVLGEFASSPYTFVETQKMLEDVNKEVDKYTKERDKHKYGTYGYEKAKVELGYYIQLRNFLEGAVMDDSYTESTKPGTDDKGYKVNKSMENYMKDSKMRTKSGNLIRYYHTMTNSGKPFTVFSGVGTPGYRYGSQEVNFFTPSPIMSASYANFDEEDYSMNSTDANKEAKYRYSGYLNIQNPYTVDAYGENWDEIEYKGHLGYSTNDIVQDVIRQNCKKLGIDPKEWKNHNLTAEQIRKAGGYDGVVIKDVVDYADNSMSFEPHDIVITFSSNQFKLAENENPTDNPDTRYSRETQSVWDEFINRWHKNTGTGTRIQDAKLPQKPVTMADFEKVIDSKVNIPPEEKKAEKGRLKDIELTAKSLQEYDDFMTLLDSNYAEVNLEQEQKRFDRQEVPSEDRAKLISKKRKEFNKDYNYDRTAVNKLDEQMPRNRNGARTVAQWKQMAKDLGKEIANLSPEEIEDIAVKSWYDLEPNKNITTYDSNLHKKVSYENFKSPNAWINSVYDGVRENRKFSVDINNVEQNQEEEVPKLKKTLNPTQISNLKPEDVSTTPMLPDKRIAKGDKASEFVNNINNKVGFLDEETKKVLTSDENVQFYKSITNAQTLSKAYKDLAEGGEKATSDWYAKESSKATPEDVAKGWILMKQYADNNDRDDLVRVARKMREMGTKSAQTLQAFNILARLTPDGMVGYAQMELQEAYDNMIKGKSKAWIDSHKADFELSQNEIAQIMDIMTNLPAENPETNNYERKVALGQIQKIISEKIPSENGKIKAWMRISMLFNPKTQVRNIAGNAGVVPVNMFSDFLGSKIDKLIAKQTGIRTLGTMNKGYLKGMKEGFYQSYNDFRLGINTRDVEGNKFELGTGKTWKDKGIGKALNRTESILNFVMDFGDRGFSQAAFVNSLNNQMLLNGVTKPTQEMIEIAQNEALSRTWNDNNDYTKFVLGLRGFLNKLGTKSYGFGDIVIPFAKTPANLTKAIVDYSPVGFTKQLFKIPGIKNAIETGQFTAQQQHDFVDLLGKGMAGSILYVVGYALAAAGIASGEGDDDKDVRNFMRYSLGIQPYSIKVGNKSFTYDWSQPIATPLAIMSNLYKQNKENPDAAWWEKAINAVNIGTDQLLEQSFMESLNEVLNGNGTTTERALKAVFDLPARAIPTFAKQIADMVDSTQRTSFEYGQPGQSAKQAMIAKLPVKSKDLTPSVDTLGNDIEKYGGENNFFNVFFNPANMNKGKKTEAAQEIYDVYEATGDTSVFPVTAPYYVNYDGEKITMSSKERAEYQRTAGKYTEKAVNQLINDSNYQSLSDDDKAEILSKVVTDSNEKAKRDVLNITKSSSDLDLIEEIGSNYYTYKSSEKAATDAKRAETGNSSASLSDTEKINVLRSKNYTDQEKESIYTKEIKNEDDEVYNSLKAINNGSSRYIDAYLDYKSTKFESDREDDGTLKGKAISGSKKDKVVDYLNKSNFDGFTRLYLKGTQYKLDNKERQQFETILNQKALTPSQKKEIYLTMNGVTEMKDGSITWK